MNSSEAEQVARLLEQFQDLFGFASAAFLPENANVTIGDLMSQLKTRNAYGGVVFGFTALALVYAYGVAEDLNFPPSIDGLLDLVRLGVTQNESKDANERPQVACFRHLRNCFAHGRFSVDVQGDQTLVTLRDFNAAQLQRFNAVCEAQVVGELAEKILIEAHACAAALALPPSPPAP